MDNSNRFPEGGNYQRALVPRAQAPAQYIDLPPAEAREDLESSGLLEYWEALKRRRGVLLLSFLVGTILGFVSIIPQPLVYNARTTLEVQGVNERFMNMGSIDMQDADAQSSSQINIQTQIRILQSDSLRFEAAAKIQRGTVPPAPPQSGLINELRNWLNVVPQEPVVFMEKALDMAANNVIAKAVLMTRIIEIKCESISPEVAAGYANGLANEFIEHSLNARLKIAQRTSRWLADQLAESKAKLEQSESKLHEYVRRTGLVVVGQQDTLGEAKLKQLQSNLSTIQADRITKQSKYEAAVSTPATAPLNSTDDTSQSSLRAELLSLRHQLAALRPTLMPAHQKVQRLEAQIAEVEGSLLKERENQIRRLKGDYETALRQERLLTSAYGSQSQTLISQADRAMGYNMLSREVEINRQGYNSMLGQVNQAAIAVAMPGQSVRIIDAAVPDRNPAKPNPIIFTAFGSLVGLMAGFGFVVMGKQSDRRVTQPLQAAHLLNVAELGVIPSARFNNSQSLFERLRAKASWGQALNGKRPIIDQRVELATWHQQPSLLAESFRGVLASILFENERGYRPRVIVLTSPGSEEGKTTVASNLAIAIAETKRRVLLIDADLRRPRLHAVFDLANSWGVSDVIQDRQPVQDYQLEALVRETEIPGLDLLSSGPATLSVSNLLYSPRLRELLERFRREYDAVLIDTPPMVQFSDARVVGRLADGAILVLRAGQTEQASALISRRHFDEDGTPVLGTILNDWYPSEKHARQLRNYYQHS